MVLSNPETLAWVLAAALPLVLWPLWLCVWLPWAIFVAWYLWEYHSFDGGVQPAGRAVYITGCDSGFGYEVAHRLDSQGFIVFAGCLYPEAEGARWLKAQASERLHIVELDVTDSIKVETCAKYIDETCRKLGLNGLWALYNNAGMSSAGEVEWFPLGLLQKQLDVNTLGVFRVTKSVLPLIRKAQGRVVTVTSGIARNALPGRFAYSMSKAAVENMMDCLRWEMKKFGVKCSTINPGNFSGMTRIFAQMDSCLDTVYGHVSSTVKADYGEDYMNAFRQNITGGYRQQGSADSVEPVIAAVCHAVTANRPKARYKPMQFGWIVWDSVMTILPNEITDFVIAWYSPKLPKPAAMQRTS